MNSNTDKACLDKAINILARRDHSCAELKKKLRSRGFNQQAITDTIKTCERLGYLNDARFTESYINQLERKGHGINAIRHKLFSRGVSSEIIDIHLRDHHNDIHQLNLCRQVLAKKIERNHNGKASVDQIPKLNRFLYSRGFEGHIIKKTIEEIL